MNYLNKFLICLCIFIQYSTVFGQQVIFIKTSNNEEWNKIDLNALNIRLPDNNTSKITRKDSLIEINIISPQTNSTLRFEIEKDSMFLNIDTLDLTINISQRLRKESFTLFTINCLNTIYEEWELIIKLSNISDFYSDKEYYIKCYETKTGRMPANYRP